MISRVSVDYLIVYRLKKNNKETMRLQTHLVFESENQET